MENSLLVVFDEIWPKTLQGTLSNFGATLKILKKSNLDRNHVKHSTQHNNMYTCTLCSFSHSFPIT